jgi:hypothetical protein
MPLDCPWDSAALSANACGDEFYEIPGQTDYPHWAFLTYAGERFGTSFVKDVVDRNVANGGVGSASSADALSDVLVAKGSSLSDAFNDWSVAHMTGAYQALGLKGSRPKTFFPTTTITTGTKTGAIPTQKVGVSHLATRYVSFKRGTGTPSGQCYAATLNLSVTLPFGVAARPYFYWTGGGGTTAIPLAVAGATATLSVPWDTCTWASGEGLLSLPNSSRTFNGVDFVVSGSLTVDTKTLTTATAPPLGTYTGPTVAAPLGDEAPSIALYGPETLRVSKKTRVVRIVVFSSGAGQLEAKLGASGLGLRSLRAGNNDLRFTLPVSAVRRLAATGKLTLTSISSSGERGTSVTRGLLITK